MAEQNKVDGIIALTYDPEAGRYPRMMQLRLHRPVSRRQHPPAWHQITTHGGRLGRRKADGKRLQEARLPARRFHASMGETNKRKDGFVAACEAMQAFLMK